ncbi:MAG: hypothetical protein AAF525_07715, partial [Pseudomonadota bacterium]
KSIFQNNIPGRKWYEGCVYECWECQHETFGRNALAKHLVTVANANGGKDNISVILIRVLKPYPAQRGLIKKIVNWFE